MVLFSFPERPSEEVSHGGNLDDALARFGGVRGEWIDLSTGVSPFPWRPSSLPGMGVQIRSEELPSLLTLDRLPTHSDLEALYEAARSAYAVPLHAGITAVPGTQSILSLLPLILPQGPVHVIGPTYMSHATRWQRAGRSVRIFKTLEEAIEKPSEETEELPRVVVLVNPNNPDGRFLTAETLLMYLKKIERWGGWMIVDEAFCDLTPSLSLLPFSGSLPLLILRSFGKFFGLPGLRLGFVVGRADKVMQIRDWVGSWPVSTLACLWGTAALRDREGQDHLRTRLHKRAQSLVEVLRQSGHVPIGGTDLFQLLAPSHTSLLRTELARRKIWTRLFRKHHWLRIGLPKTTRDLLRLHTALQEIRNPT